MERYLWDLLVLSVRTLFWIARMIVAFSPWLMDVLYAYVVGPLLGQERVLRMGRAAVVVQCIVIQALIWGGLLALLFGGDLSVAFWGVVVGVWAGFRGGNFVADSIEQINRMDALEVHDPLPDLAAGESAPQEPRRPLNLEELDDIVETIE